MKRWTAWTVLSLLLAACALTPRVSREAPIWEPVWLMLPDGSEVKVEGQRVPWAPPGYVVVQGDILVPRAPARPEALTPQGLALEPLTWGRLWPYGVVPYEVDPGVSPGQRGVIQQALAHVQEKTPIRFVPRTTEADYVRFISDGVPGTCWSVLGRAGGVQDLDVYCGRDGVPSMGTVVHEILHALGFMHEQSRADRDAYVEILWENIQEEYWGQFAKIGGRGKLYQAYDYDSVMHYHAKAFSKNGGYTILPKNGVPGAPWEEGWSESRGRGGRAPLLRHPLLRLRWWFHQTTYTTDYTFPQELLNVGAVDARVAGVVLEGRWLQGAELASQEISAGGSSTVTFRAKACPGPGLQAEKVAFQIEGGETYEVSYTRACYRYPHQTTLLRLDPAGRETFLLTYGEWTWAKEYALEGRVGNTPISLPLTRLTSERSQPLYTALVPLRGLAGEEVCLRITPLDSSSNPTSAEACAVVP